MRYLFFAFLTTLCLSVLISCGGKDKKATGTDPITDTTSTNTSTPDTTLAPARASIEKGLEKWAASFTNFSVDSFRQSQKDGFGNEPYDAEDMNNFYELYKASLIYSADSSQFIDLYSSGIMLEKNGKKVIASADVDQAVTLSNTKTKEWKRVAFFGPSAGIEEAVWVSATSFVLAGMMVNDNGDKQAMIMLGDLNDKSFRWFESNLIRPKSSKYEPSGVAKLKIDEWE